MDRPVAVDPVHALDRLLDRLEPLVARVSEVDPSLLVDADPVRGVELPALVVGGQDHAPTGAHVGLGHPLAAVVGRFADHQVALGVEVHAVGLPAGRAPDAGPTVAAVVLPDDACLDVAVLVLAHVARGELGEVDVATPVRGRAGGQHAAALEQRLQFGAGTDDVRVAADLGEVVLRDTGRRPGVRGGGSVLRVVRGCAGRGAGRRGGRGVSGLDEEEPAAQHERGDHGDS